MVRLPPLSTTARRLLLSSAMTLLTLPVAAMNDGPAGPWGGFPRTYPTPRYENDPAADFSYHFGVTKAFSPYKDPDQSVALQLPNPLDDPDLDSYNLIVVISKSDDDFWGPEQTLRVYKRGSGLLYYWLVSTGMQGHETAAGYFSPKEFSSRHWSAEYDAPMLWAIFFHGGMALHSSLDRASIADMGKAAESHGCVHEEDYRAEEMFHLVGQSGYGPVDQIGEKSGRPTGRTISAYRTLIIIGPTTPWDSNSPKPLRASLKWSGAGNDPGLSDDENAGSRASPPDADSSRESENSPVDRTEVNTLEN
jgi:hypothetical protein